MSFDAEETSIESGRPAWLFEFRIASVVTYLSGVGQDVTLGGQTYRAATITTSQPTVSRAKAGSEITIEIAFNEDAGAPVSRAWLSQAPESLSTVKIRKLHRGDAAVEGIYFWIGFVVSVSYDSISAKVLCRALPDMFSKQGPRMNWGTSCNHVLYDQWCTLSAEDYTQTVTVSAIAADGITYTLTGLTGLTDGDLVGGKIAEVGGFAQRLITQHVGSSVTLQYPCDELFVGATVNVVQGCAHDLDACQNKFSNSINYGGHPYVPRVNPFERGLKAFARDQEEPRIPFSFL